MYYPSKELPAVIKALEICGSAMGCLKCPYSRRDGTKDCTPKQGNHLMLDCLYYLKKFQKSKLGVK